MSGEEEEIEGRMRKGWTAREEGRREGCMAEGTSGAAERDAVGRMRWRHELGKEERRDRVKDVTKVG